jgi:putative nucleotidyltransferase with HDIG domain
MFNISKFKLIVLFVVMMLSASAYMIYHALNSNKAFIALVNKGIVQEATAHFENMVVSRKWNAQHGGVYVKQHDNLEPNPYLKDNHLYSKDGELLIKINPAWMSRQISDISNKESSYFYKITSLKPINPINAPDSFEKEALDFFDKNPDEKYYYRFDENLGKFNFLGALKTVEACLTCHAEQGYKLGDIRGGIRVTLPTNLYKQTVDEVKDETLKTIITIVIADVLAFMLFIVAVNVIYARQKEVEILNKTLEQKVDQKLESIKEMQIKNIQNYEETILSFVNIIEQRDSYTAGHTLRVAKYSSMIAKAMNLEADEIEKLEKAAILHDIGKVATPDAILLKPGKLSDLEYELIKQHSEAGYNMLKNIEMYKNLAQIIRYHHARYDGKGYPQTKHPKDIPFASHIMAVADAFDAMTSNRIYKPSKSVSEAIEEIKHLSGTQFHPEVVECAVDVFKNVLLVEKTTQKASSELEEKRFAYFFHDALTETFNENYLQTILSDSGRVYEYLYLVQLRNFTQYNNIHGWEEGDKFLKEFALSLKKLFSDALIIRFHGDDFILLFKEKKYIDSEMIESINIFKNSSVHAEIKYDRLYEKIYNIHSLLKGKF